MNFKSVKNNRGTYLIKMALLLPILVMFWGWIISQALILDHKISYQTAADMAALSGASYARNQDLYRNSNRLHASMIARSQQLLSTFGYDDIADPIVSSTNDEKTITVMIENQPSVDLLFMAPVALGAQAQATIINADTVKLTGTF